MKHANYLLFLAIWISYAFLRPAHTTYEVGDRNDGIISVTDVTTSSVTLRWKFDQNFTDDFIHLVTRYRPRVRISTPAVLEWNESDGHYVAEYAHSPRETTFRWNFVNTFFEQDDANVVYIAMNNLEFPGVDYDFDVRRIEREPEGGNITLQAKLVVRTEAVVPEKPPKSGSGCFHVYEVDESSRKVKIYWQGVHGKYELIVYEAAKSGPQSVAVYAETGESYLGFTWCNISLARHYVILRSVSDAGVSANFSTINIPPQDELLPAHPVSWNYTKNRYEMTWQTPENVNVTNYTAFWVDTLDGSASVRIADFVYLSRETNSFVAEGRPYVDLGMSVNTATSSTGLQVARRTQR